MAKRSKPASKRGGAKKKKTPLASKSVKTASTAGGIDVVCSECYSDFLYVPKSSSSSLNCPACGHTGTVPESAEVQRLIMAKAAESKAFLTASIPAGLFLLVTIYYLYKLSSGSLDTGMNYGLLGGSVVLFLVTLIFSARFEKSRCEVYF
ncbi:MAG: hypothetical protein H8E43_04310 [Planctomycetia bacterium]|nr:hypothetical protein [Planctomycetia bacterium]MBL6914767.1 hypothetical protein [Planctomycetota bacterium]HCW43715.1 hypothetical protein [Planctomycetota bacterium]